MNCSVPEKEVKPVIATRHQTSCPELAVSQTAVTLPIQRKSVITSPVTTIDSSVNDDFSIGPKGAQRNPVIQSPSCNLELLIFNKI